jgi:hypothetical protein
MIRRILTALTLVAIAPSAFGAVIERIEVREGKEYSEDEVRRAAYERGN